MAAYRNEKSDKESAEKENRQMKKSSKKNKIMNEEDEDSIED